MGIQNRGFASMDRAKARKIASLGGKAAHAKGVAYVWNSEQARDAGRKGGIATAAKRKAQSVATVPAAQGGGQPGEL